MVAFTVLLTVGPRGSAQAGPVCIPAGTTVAVTADAKVSSVHPRRNYGRADTWKANYAPTNARSFFTFGLPNIPTGCAVTEAVLDLSGTYSGKPKPQDHWPGANVNISLVRSHWTERRVTWKNQPGANACDGGGQDLARTSSWLITGLVQEAYQCLDNGRLAAFNGIKVKGWSPRNRGASWRLVIDSRESKHPPAVEISWG